MLTHITHALFSKRVLTLIITFSLALIAFSFVTDNAQAKTLYKMPKNGHYSASTENQIVTLINKERTKRHLKKLTVKSNLRTYARDQSRAQYLKKKMAHGLFTFSFHTARGQNVEFAAGASNYNSWGALLSPKEAVKAWMASPSHRANILNKKYKYTGVGVSYGTKKTDKNGINRWVFFTQNFSN